MTGTVKCPVTVPSPLSCNVKSSLTASLGLFVGDQRVLVRVHGCAVGVDLSQCPPSRPAQHGGRHRPSLLDQRPLDDRLLRRGQRRRKLIGGGHDHGGVCRREIASRQRGVGRSAFPQALRELDLPGRDSWVHVRPGGNPLTGARQARLGGDAGLVTSSESPRRNAATFDSMRAACTSRSEH